MVSSFVLCVCDRLTDSVPTCRIATPVFHCIVFLLLNWVFVCARAVGEGYAHIIQTHTLLRTMSGTMSSGSKSEAKSEAESDSEAEDAKSISNNDYILIGDPSQLDAAIEDMRVSGVYECVLLALSFILSFTIIVCVCQCNDVKAIYLDISLDEKQSERLWCALKVSHDLFRVLFVHMCFADPSTLMCSYVIQINKSVKELRLWDGFALDKPDKWMVLALQVRELCC